jgi:glycosyltransferase involved in cell wall biosynthesis
MDARFADWLRVVAAEADDVLCISRTVADEAGAAMAAPAGRSPRIAHFPLGCDLVALTPPRRGLPVRQPGHVRCLMVGTVEPRKGYAQALDAFEAMWARGIPVELAVVGRAGWQVERLLARLASHPERDRRLHWIQGADDAELLAAYRDCDVLLAASEGEGYGLPLVEAAALGLPVLARDLPVFREVAGEGAEFFRGAGAADLDSAVCEWITFRSRGETPDPARIGTHTWRESAEALAAALMGG